MSMHTTSVKCFTCLSVLSLRHTCFFTCPGCQSSDLFYQSNNVVMRVLSLGTESTENAGPIIIKELAVVKLHSRNWI